MPEFVNVASIDEIPPGTGRTVEVHGVWIACLMSTDPSTPSTTPVHMREDRSEKVIWMELSSNVRGTAGDSTYKPENDPRIPLSPSPAVPSESKGIRFRSRCRRTSPNRRDVARLCATVRIGSLFDETRIDDER